VALETEHHGASGHPQIDRTSAGASHPGRARYPLARLYRVLNYRRVKARNVRNFDRRLQEGWNAYCAGEITFAEFDSSVQG
jgi:hypothetical protein